MNINEPHNFGKHLGPILRLFVFPSAARSSRGFALRLAGCNVATLRMRHLFCLQGFWRAQAQRGWRTHGKKGGHKKGYTSDRRMDWVPWKSTRLHLNLKHPRISEFPKRIEIGKRPNLRWGISFETPSSWANCHIIMACVNPLLTCSRPVSCCCEIAHGW